MDTQLNALRREILLMAEARDKALELARAETRWMLAAIALPIFVLVITIWLK